VGRAFQARPFFVQADGFTAEGAEPSQRHAVAPSFTTRGRAAEAAA
jgi:hypothetical protein